MKRIVFVVILLFIVLGVFLFFNNRDTEVVTTPPDTRPTPRLAYDVAVSAARMWRSDAQLSLLHSTEDVGATGRGNGWRFVFVSSEPDMKGRGYEVVVYAQTVVAREEIAYMGSGAAFPSTIISQEDAIARVRSFPGYEFASVLGIEAVYGPKEQSWYWGVRTPNGVVSVEAPIK